MNSIFISLVSAMAFSVLLAISERNVVVSSEAIKVTDWIQAFGSVVSVAIALVAAVFAIMAAKSTEKIAINQSIMNISKDFSEKINEAVDMADVNLFGCIKISSVSNFITLAIRARQGIDSLSTRSQKVDNYKILNVYLSISSRLEIRDWTKFYLSLLCEIEHKKELFFDDGNYNLWLTIQQQYKDMRAVIFPSEPEGEHIKNIQALLSKDIMIQKFEKAGREENKEKWLEVVKEAQDN
ncbi:MAG: hypothetical protein AB7D19_07680 [Acetobacter sp.]|uniref:hypothetical protein n=1 Tax=Acetobacter sp. TaxID=440 RepID=UPI003D0005BA